MVAPAADLTGQYSTAEWGRRAAEWGALYSQYLMRAASQSTKTLGLYQQVLDCVARGELPPTVFQDLQPAFIQAHGAAYRDQFTEITMRFFSRMIQISAVYADELSELAVLGMVEPPLQPPQLDTADPVQWFQQLNEYLVQLNARAMRSYQALIERLAAGELPPAQLQEVSASYVEERLPEQLHRLSVLYFDLLNGLNELQTAYQEQFLQDVLASVEGEPPFELRLVATLGETASASMSLTNTTDRPATIRCVATEIRRADGVGPAFAPQFNFEPDSLDLQPDEEASMLVSLPLEADQFEAGALYVGDLQITGHGEPRFEVPLRIKATPPDGNATADSSQEAEA